jgi:plastocyanin
MKKRGNGVIAIIVFIGLTGLIVWSLNFVVNRDFAATKAPAVITLSDNAETISVTTVMQATSSTPTTTPATTTPKITLATVVATSTQTKNPVTEKPAADTTAPPTSSALTVTFTDKGFSPTSLTVKKGQTVKFVNNSSSKMWVAANPFPSSSEYPAFNEKAGVASGSSWSFTFDKTGVWFYHNHYNQTLGAKIVVNAK